MSGRTPPHAGNRGRGLLGGLFGRRSRAEPEPRATSTADPRFWKQLRPGGSVSLRDFQAMEEAAERGLDADGLDYQIGNRRAIEVRSAAGTAVAEYLLFDLTSADHIYFLLAVIRGDDLNLRVYFIADGLAPGPRAAVLESGGTWFFETPADPDRFVPAELEFARHPALPPIVDGGREVQAEFVSHGGALYGDYADRDGKRVPVILMEYETQDDIQNPLLLIVEEGGLDADGDSIPEGGFMTVLMGSRIDRGQVEVFPG
jgi:hypothetical protein